MALQALCGAMSWVAAVRALLMATAGHITFGQAPISVLRLATRLSGLHMGLFSQIPGYLAMPFRCAYFCLHLFL